MLRTRSSLKKDRKELPNAYTQETPNLQVPKERCSHVSGDDPTPLVLSSSERDLRCERLYSLGFEIPVPEVPVKVDGVIRADFYAIISQKLRLNIYPAERERGRKSAEAVHHAKARDLIRLGIGVQRVTDGTRPPLVPREVGYLPVSGDFAARYLLNDLVDLLKCRHTYPLSAFFTGLDPPISV